MNEIIPSTLMGNSLVKAGISAPIAQETIKPKTPAATQALPSSVGCSCMACKPLNTETTNNQKDEVSSYSPEGVKANKGSSKNNRTSEERNAEAIKKLKERDTEVRAHEAAHIAAAGGLAQGGAKFTYQRGPDGQLYAIGGSVSIDIQPISGDPKATLDKAHVIRAAALAPAEPSGQDQAVAAAAAQMAQAARQEMSQQQETPYGKESSEKSKEERTGTQQKNEHSTTSSSTSPTSASTGKLSSEFGRAITSTIERRLQTALRVTQMFDQMLDVHA